MGLYIKDMEMPTTGMYFVGVDNAGGRDKTIVTVERMLGNRDVRQIIGSFELVPVDNMRPVVRGKWIKPTRVPDSMLSECSVCGFDTGAYSFNYCPKCGCAMEEC